MTSPTRVTIGKRIVVYGGDIRLVCSKCRKELPPDSFYRSGTNHLLHRHSPCKDCYPKRKYQRIPKDQWKPRVGGGWPKGKPRGPQPRHRGELGRFSRMATVEQARAEAARRGWMTA